MYCLLSNHVALCSAVSASLCPCTQNRVRSRSLWDAQCGSTVRLATPLPAAGTHGPKPGFAASPALPPRATASSRPRACSVHLCLQSTAARATAAARNGGPAGARGSAPSGPPAIEGRLSGSRGAQSFGPQPPAHAAAPPPPAHHFLSDGHGHGRGEEAGGCPPPSPSPSPQMPFAAAAAGLLLQYVVAPSPAPRGSAPLRSRPLAAGRGRSARRSRSAPGRHPTPRRAAARGAPGPARALRREGTNGRRAPPLPSAPRGAPPPSLCAAAVGGAVAGPAARQRGDVRLRIIAD